MADLNSKEWQQKSLHDSNAIIIDVRTKDEVAEGMIPHAINIDVKEPSLFLEQVNKLDKSKNFYMYCQSGARSAQACAVLNLMCDIPNTYSLVGGFSAWNKDFPI